MLVTMRPSEGTFRSRQRSAVLLGILGLSVAVAFGQNSNSSGIAVLRTVVADPSGVRIPSTKIVFKGEKTITADTGEDGSIRVHIPYGSYSLTISHPGFETAKIADLTIKAAKPPDLGVVLHVNHCCDEPPIGGDEVGPQLVASDVPNMIGAAGVPDAGAALKIAEPVLIKTYGKRQIDDERPLTATLDNGVWTVSGTLWCTDRSGHRTHQCFGGTAVLKLRQSDGKILSIIHYK